MIDCGALFPSPPFASLGLAERLLRFARNDALTPVRFATSTRLFEAGTFGGPSPLGRVAEDPSLEEMVCHPAAAELGKAWVRSD